MEHSIFESDFEIISPYCSQRFLAYTVEYPKKCLPSSGTSKKLTFSLILKDDFWRYYVTDYVIEKKSIAYIRLDVQMIPCSSKQPYQLNFMTQKRFNCQHFNVPGLRWSGFESHIWLMNLIKAKNEIDFEFGSDFHNQMWFHNESKFLFFTCFVAGTFQDRNQRSIS